MIRNHLLGLTWLAILCANAPAQETPATEQVLGLFKVTEMGKHVIELKGVATTTCRPALRDLEIYDCGGKKLTRDDLRHRVKVGSVVLVATHATTIDASYLSVLKEDTVVLVGVTVVPARTDKLPLDWTFDLDKMKPSHHLAAKKILGAEFKLDKIQLLNSGLSPRSAK